MPDNSSGMNKLYSSYIYFWTAYRFFVCSKMLMLLNILRLKSVSKSLGAQLFAYQEVRVTGLLGVIVLCS